MTENQLGSVRLFEFLTDEERSEILEESQRASYAAGEEIISERARAGSLFVLISGRVEVVKGVPGGDDRLLAEIDADESRTVVGERGLLSDSPASATVRAVTPVDAVRIPRHTFRRMVAEGRPAAFKLSYRIARTLAQRLVRLDEEVVETMRDLESRGETDLEAFRDRLVHDWAL